jgi:hypothetical protein
MSVDAIYKGRRARVVDDYAPEGEGWVGVILELWGGSEPFPVRFGDPDLEVEPTDLDPDDTFDERWEAAR